MIIPDNDIKRPEKKAIFIYIIALLFLLLIVFSLGYLFRDSIKEKNIEEKCNIVKQDNITQKFSDIKLYKNFEEFNINYKDNRILNVKIEKNQTSNVVYIQEEKTFTFNNNEYLDTIYMVDDYFIIPIVGDNSVVFYYLNENGSLIKKDSEINGLSITKYYYDGGRLYVEAEMKSDSNICELQSYNDIVAYSKYELLYIEKENFIYKTDKTSQKYLSDIISEKC